MIRLLLATTVAGTLRAFLLPLADHFRSLGWQVDAMAQGVTRSRECLEHFDRVWEVGWSRNPLHPRNLASAPRRVQEVAATGGYDLIHVHTPVAAFVTRFALRKLYRRQVRPRLIYTAHGFHFHPGGSLLRNGLFTTLERLAGRWTDHLVVINQEDWEAALHLDLVREGQLHRMAGIGVDTSRYSPDKVSATEVDRIRRELGLAAETPLFLLIAAFQPSKRHKDALLALARLGRPEVHLACAGSGPLLPKMQRLTERLGLAGRVHFLGYRRDIPPLIRAATATILPSEREGLPRSVMESLSLETPVIGTTIRGVTELLADGSGLLVPVGNPDRLAGAMRTLLENREEARLMGRLGRAKMAAYDTTRILAHHEELYQSALALASPGPG